MPFDIIRDTVEFELDVEDLYDVFDSFDTEPAGWWFIARSVCICSLA